MGPKKKIEPKASKKTIQKEKDRIIEDKTFGLKNKNKSSKVAAYVSGVKATVGGANSKDAKKAEMAKAEKNKAKEEKAAFEAELKKLYQGEKSKKEKKKEEQAAENDPMFLSAEDRALAGEYVMTADDFDAVEEDASRLEEKLEKQLQELRARQAEDPSLRTPVNAETFAAWKVKKQQEKEEAEQKAVQKFKKTGAGLSGRALFAHDASLFVDDDGAFDEYMQDEEEEDEDDSEE